MDRRSQRAGHRGVAVAILLATLVAGTGRAAERWQAVEIRDDLAAAWLERPGSDGECDVALVVFLKGADGWLAADAGIERARGRQPRQWLPDPAAPRTASAFRSGEVVVPLHYGGDPTRAVVWSYDVPVEQGHVLLVSGIGEDGPRLKTLGTYRATCDGEAAPPQRLYERLVQLRAKIHYSR